MFEGILSVDGFVAWVGQRTSVTVLVDYLRGAQCGWAGKGVVKCSINGIDVTRRFDPRDFA